MTTVVKGLLAFFAAVLFQTLAVLADQSLFESIFPPQHTHSGYCLAPKSSCTALNRSGQAMLRVLDSEDSNGTDKFRAITSFEQEAGSHLRKSVSSASECIEPVGKFIVFQSPNKHAGVSYALMSRSYEKVDDECYFRRMKDF